MLRVYETESSIISSIVCSSPHGLADSCAFDYHIATFFPPASHVFLPQYGGFRDLSTTPLYDVAARSGTQPLSRPGVDWGAIRWVEF